MLEEMSALLSNQTWDLVPLPPGKSVVGCRWVFTVKVSPDGSVDRLKARLVAKGFTQIPGLDYEDTFSPVAKITSIRLLFSLAAQHNWHLHQLDIKNAFLNGDLQEEVYMEQPHGFVAQGECGPVVCRLRKALYGLKQSPRAWFGRFSDTVIKFGLRRSVKDHSVFYRISPTGKRILLVVYVDDILITGDDSTGIDSLKEFLRSQFQTKDLGALKYFLGIEVARSAKGILICQRKYTLDILSEAGLLGSRPSDTPMSPYVFVLCMERLAQAINLEVAKGTWKPMVFGGGRETLSHLFFADDLLLFAEATLDQVEVIRKTVETFCKFSGQTISHDKSVVHQMLILRLLIL